MRPLSRQVLPEADMPLSASFGHSEPTKPPAGGRSEGLRRFESSYRMVKVIRLRLPHAVLHSSDRQMLPQVARGFGVNHPGPNPVRIESDPHSLPRLGSGGAPLFAAQIASGTSIRKTAMKSEAISLRLVPRKVLEA